MTDWLILTSLIGVFVLLLVCVKGLSLLFDGLFGDEEK